MLFFFPVAECPVITLPSNAHTDTDNRQEGTVVGKFLGLVGANRFSPRLCDGINLPNGPFTLSVSVNAGMLLAISL